MYPKDEAPQPKPKPKNIGSGVPRTVPQATTIENSGRVTVGPQQDERRGTFGHKPPIQPLVARAKNPEKKPEPNKPQPDNTRRGTFGEISNPIKPAQNSVAPVPEPFSNAGSKHDGKRFGRYFGADDNTAARAADYGQDPRFNKAAAVREEFDFYAKMAKKKDLDGVLERGEQARKSRGRVKTSV